MKFQRADMAFVKYVNPENQVHRKKYRIFNYHSILKDKTKRLFQSTLT